MTFRLTGSEPIAKAADRGPATPAELDAALLREVANGNQLAMRSLFLRHRIRVYRFIRRTVSDPTLAEDLVSEVFLAAWQQAGRFKGHSLVSTWLLSIARHKAFTAIKRPRFEQLDGEAAAAIPDPALDPEAEIRERDRGTILRRCLSALSPDHGEMIDLVYYQQKSINEIAEILEIPANTVKTRMFYARRRLATLLEQAGFEHRAHDG